MSISQLDFQLHNAGVSQCDRILARLKQAPNAGVAMPELYRVSGSLNVHSRIAELRKRGHVIDQWNEWEGGMCKSFYRLVKEL